MGKFAVILPAAGRSSRFGDKEKKPFINLDGRAIWLRSAELFTNRDDVVQTLLVIAPEDREMVERRYRANLMFLGVTLVDGGSERFESVAKALEVVKPEAEFIAVHDSVRPCTQSEHVDRVFEAAKRFGAALLGVPVADTLKRAGEGQKVVQTIPRKNLWHAQTPQVARADWLRDAYAQREKLKEAITDDAQLLEAVGKPVVLVEGSSGNLKITTREDLVMAEAVLKSRLQSKAPRQIHPFAEDQSW